MKIENSYIYLRDLRLYAYHGVGPQENLIGNEYTLQLKCRVDISRAMATDDVTDTVSYAEVYEVVKQEMSTPSRLLEHVGGRIVERLFACFPGIKEIELDLAKRNPPMGADVDSAGIVLRCVR
ncbi:MAG: dihydroneopterin aldolase [Mediterranea sp.]|jgi:dihydroneopterin aldolase|nr:dihydroneopterin aldolase [Mediterranea sp.]